jgi:hypothetical protein
MDASESIMKKRPAAAVLGAWLLAAGFPSPSLSGQVRAPATSVSRSKPASSGAAGAVATHATTGVVKTVTETMMVVVRRVGGKRTESSFVLTPATQRAGHIAAGATVDVRYRTEGRQKIATAVTVEAAPE